MKKISVYTISLCFVLGSFQWSQAQTPSARRHTKWKLTWSDEFNYKGLPDSTKWGYETGRSGWGNNELQLYTAADTSNAKVENGFLYITARNTGGGDNKYTSARMTSRNKGDWKYGKLEVRAQLPAGRGLWPAIWMMPTRNSYGGWPASGEIDVMEHVGYMKDSIFGSLHSKTYNHVIGTQKTKGVFIKDPYSKFHVYGVEWTPDNITFLLDGKVYYQGFNEHKTFAEWPFDKPFYLLLNVAVGGNWGGKHGVDDTVFPAAMQVDYVRMYKWVE
ncbi:glycoside hydrolase family 16 protein [Chitinophaga sp. 212800010-3]|uniref:glycoside hydrolase family 16 protein n=1 Tax=unclassified Chitinophaga TaxID=2619133 RepID=UPI002DF1998C|nr:Glycoside hydrolase family 16 [Chitinophaga sp. 212800010-3]